VVGVKIGNVLLSSRSLTPKIAVNVSGETALRKAKAAEQQNANILEVRCDLFDNFDPDYIVQTFQDLREITKLPLLATMRQAWVSDEGKEYKFAGSEGDRLEIFKRIMPYVDAVDIELKSKIRERILDEAEKYGKPVIISHHDFQKTGSLDELKKIVDEAFRTRGNIIKISTMACSREDVVTSLRLLLSYTENDKCENKPIAVISMGKLGQVSRIAFPLFGSCLTYAHLDEDITYKAPGQIDVGNIRQF
jgi:3-dehydroquinate dehydratase I